MKTSLFSVAEARFDAKLLEHRERKQTTKDATRGKLTFGEALTIARRQMEANPESKPSTHAYHAEVFTTIHRGLPEFEDPDVIGFFVGEGISRARGVSTCLIYQSCQWDSDKM